MTASTTAKIDATSTTKIEAFDKSLGFVAVFNTIGWKPSNLLFNLVDAILGDPLTSSAFNGDATPSAARAFIRDTPVTATGALSVTATQAAQLTATAGNEGLADAALDAVLMTAWQTNGLAGGGLLASNKVNTTAEASLSFTGAAGTVQAGGAVAVTATDSAGVESHSTLTETANVSNTAAGLAAYLDRLVPLDYDYTTASGARTLATGDHVRVGPTYGGAGIKGAVYVFNGAPGSVDLGAENYLDTVRWTRVDTSVNPSAFYPNLGNLTKSSARAIGILIVLNDVRSTATATVTKVALSAASVLVGATESAQILAEATNAITASGGSFYGSGTVLAVSGQMVTNRVVTHTTADAEREHGDGDRGRHRRHGRQRGRHRRDAAHHAQQRRPGRVGLAGLQHAWLQALQRALQPDRRDPRRPADLDGVQGRGPGARARHGHGHDAQRDRRRHGLSDQPRRAQRHRQQRRGLGGRGAVLRQGHRRSARSWPPTRSPAAPARRSTAARSRRPARSRSPRPTRRSIHANIKVVASSITTNNGGTAVLQQEINNFKGAADFLTTDGLQDIRLGQTVRTPDGKVYAWMGVDGPVDLADRRLHRPRPVEAGARHRAGAAGHQLHAVAVDRDRRRGGAQRRPRRRQRDAQEPERRRRRA